MPSRTSRFRLLRAAHSPVSLSTVAVALRRAVCAAVALTLTAAPLTAGPARAQSQPIELPSLGEAAADDLSPTNERKLGEAIMRQVVQDPSYLADPDVAEYLNALGYLLVSSSPARHMDFGFFAVRDPMLNAFALPGGFIGIHSGLVLAAQSESELAGVMAHEIGHVEQRHIARMLASQRQGTAIAIGALLLALLAARSNSSSSADLTQAAILGGQAAAIQQQLNFSREAEREADRVGLQILDGAGFDPRGMVMFFNRLQQNSRVYESAAPAYLRTHPLTVERISDLQTRIKDSRVRQRPDSLDFALVRARLRVLQDPTLQGARDAQTYFTEQIRNRTAASEAAAHYGAALASLRLNDVPRAVAAAQRARTATKQPSAMLDKLVSETRFAAAGTPAERDAVLTLAHDAAARFPLSRLTAMHYAELLYQSGRHDAAVAYLREQLALPRSEPAYYNLMARSYAELGRRTLQHQAVAESYLLLGALPLAVEQLQMARKAGDADFYTLSEIDARLRQLTQQLKERRDELARQGRRPPEEENRDRRR